MSSIMLLRFQSLRRFLFSFKSDKLVLNSKMYIHFKNALRNSNLSNEVSKAELLNNVKSNPEKDKLLFYYENPRFFLCVNGFAFVHFFFWVHLSELTYKKLKDVDLYKGTISDNLYWWQKLDFKDDRTRTAVATFCFFMGYVVLAGCWIYTLRSVRMLVLRKGGKTVSIVTYAPLGGRRTSDFPLEKLTTSQTRQSSKNQLPIKVQGKWFYYILDTKNGTFHNPVLFDYTAGMKRTFSK